MTDLSDFGVDVGDPDESATDTADTDNDTSDRTYRNGRCPAITRDGRRCRSPVSRMNSADGFCGVHGRQYDPLTIHDDPETLVRATAANRAQCRALLRDGGRCTNSCGALSFFCGVHKGWDQTALPDAGELDVELVLDAIEAVGGEDG